MKLRSLTLTNFRNYEKFEIDFNEKLNVIVAENGVGKTTLLDAIAVGYGAMLTRLPKVKGNNFEKTDVRISLLNKIAPYVRVALETFNDLQWDRTLSRDQSKKTKEMIPEGKELKNLYHYVDGLIDQENGNIPFELPLIMYYGTSRAVLKTPMRKRNFQKQFSRFEALSGSLDANADFHTLFQWYDAMEDQERRAIKEKRDFDYVLPSLQSVRLAISTMMPGFVNPRIETRPLRFLIDKKSESNELMTLRIEQLSDGNKIVLATVMDIARRMAEANGHMENPLESQAVIMIDEVDLHLHPRWQQTILDDLQKTFPNAQFIVTTHSPQVLTTVSNTSIQGLTLIDEQPKLKKFNFSYGARSHELLNNILGVNERPQHLEIVKKLNKYLALVDQNEYFSEEAKQLREELDQWGAGKEKELLNADMDIRLKEYQKNR
jgi:predicted ATP-binding protein involved in virulence